MSDPLYDVAAMLAVLMAPIVIYGLHLKHELDKMDREDLAEAAQRRR
jgi:hypothetical protein